MEESDLKPDRAALCVLLTCYNRRELTLRSLGAVRVAARAAGLDWCGVLVDDGSSDGTGESVRVAFPEVTVVRHEGPPLFWCRGMHRAMTDAAAQGHDNYLLLNDDTELVPHALVAMQACAARQRQEAGAPVIVIGSVCDPDTGHPTYGGRRRVSRWRPISLALIEPSTLAQPADSFDGNVVWIPAEVRRQVGDLDAGFEHAMGDLDYGLRAGRCGVRLWVAPGWVGTCRSNPSQGTFHDRSLPWRARWRHFASRRHLPWRSWMRLTRRHAGPLWPLYFVWPYARMLLSGLVPARAAGAGEGPR